MYNFLLNNGYIFSIIIFALEIALLTLFILKYLKYKRLFILVAIVISVEAIYNSLIVVLSALLNSDMIHSQGFEVASKVKYILNGALMPLLIVLCVDLLNIRGRNKYIILTITLVLVILGVIEGSFTKLEIETVGTVSRYVLSASTPKWVMPVYLIIMLVSILSVMVCGTLLLTRKNNSYILVGGLIMFTFETVTHIHPTISVFSYLITILAEFFLLSFIYIHIISFKENKNV